MENEQQEIIEKFYEFEAEIRDLKQKTTGLWAGIVCQKTKA